MIKLKLCGILVTIDFFFVAAVTLFLLTDKTGYSIMGFTACLMHEAGHIVAFLAVGAKPQTLAFEVTGIRLQEPAYSLSRWRMTIVLLAGSGVNFLVFLILSRNMQGDISQLGVLAATHLLVGAFNLLPLKGFDGGKLMRLFLSLFAVFISEYTREKIYGFIDFLFVILLAILCVMFFIASKNSLTLIIMTGYLLITSIMKIAKQKP